METIKIYEVGPRDGLQNEKKIWAAKDKIQLITLLAEAGLPYIEATSFVSPKWIPQMADSQLVAGSLPSLDKVTYSALVPNEKGLARAMEAGLKEIAVFISASETHNKKNQNKTIPETLQIMRRVVSEAVANRLRVRGYISTVFGCPYEGEIEAAASVHLAREMLAMGIYEVSLGDTIGAATPKQVKETLQQLVQQCPAERLAGHFHDTRGTGLANVYAAIECGLRTFDSSVGGIGGCPYAPGAAGNISTEDLVYMLNGMGFFTGVDLQKLVKAGLFAQAKLGRRLPSKVLSTYSGESGCLTAGEGGGV